MNQVTRILSTLQRGDPRAARELLPLVYEELRKLAAHRLNHEAPGQTLQATALVNEAYLRLVEGDQDRAWDGRGHFFAAAAEAMRRILIDNARRKRRPKHGGDLKRIDLEKAVQVSSDQQSVSADDLLALDDALTKLADREPAKAELVKLRFFAGMTIPDAAKVMGISEATAQRYWTYARVWLYCELEQQGQAPDSANYTSPS